MSEDLNYRGPDLEYDPPIGANLPKVTAPAPTEAGYHDLDYLDDLLNELLETSGKLVVEAEKDLQSYVLRVEEGSKLEEAHLAEWPTELGESKSYVSYDEYKSLEHKNTRGARYIRKMYEDSLRGTSGTNAIDVIALASNIKNEASNIKEFLDEYINDVNDTAEYRTLELLQDWTENAIYHTGNLRGLFQKRVQTPKIPTSELDQVTPERAQEYQALFKVEVNALNNQISQIQEEAKKENFEFSNIYFNKFLGPSLKFRLGAGRGLENEVGRKTLLGGEAAKARNTLNTNLSVILSDQIRRNTSFDQKMVQLQSKIQERDKYVSYISQLSNKGKGIKNPFVNISVPADETEYFGNVTEATTSNIFKSLHEALDSTDDDNAHPQYLLRAGGIITGDIDVDDDITIDGVDLDLHNHSGADGSAMIPGTSIIPGTMPTESVDTEDIPAAPTLLSLVSQTQVLSSPGTVTIDAVVSWDGSNQYTYDVQISRLD